MGKGPLLEVSGLEVSYLSDNQIVNAVSGAGFTLFKGRTLGLAGASGSGKTALALALMGLLPAPAGKVTGGKALFRPSDGEPADLLTLSPHRHRLLRGREMAMVFQEPLSALNPVFTCGRQVAESLERREGSDRAAARKDARELLKKVGLKADDFYAYPHQLSGGQRQRIMLAMAVACRPSLLIADEPTTALDMTTQAGILSLMRRLQEENDMAILFISHDLDVIGEMADEVMVMRQGRVIESGPADTVLRNPSHAYTRSMLHIQPGGRAPGRAPDDGQPLLEVHELKLGFASVGRRPGIRALDGVSLRVYPGETLGLAGESGCGKSTLCRSILRLAEPGSGSVRFRGEEVTTMESPSLRRFRTQVQIVFQDPYSSLNPRMTVADILAEPMRVHGLYGRTESQRRAGALLESVGLDHGYGSRYPHELSAGQRQRVCIARALAVDPALIICDEPVSSLDTPARAQVLALLQKLKEERKLSLVFVSHDLSVIRHISDRVAVMHEGRIVETDTPEALFENPVSEHTIKLIDAIPASVRSSLSAYSS